MRSLLALGVLAGLTRAAGPAQRGWDFGPPVNLGAVNSSAFDGGPSISADGLSLYFTSERPGGYGGGDLWVARRWSRAGGLWAPENLGPGVNSAANEFAPSISADGLTIYFDSDRPGSEGASDVWVATRATTAEPFGDPRRLPAPVNTTASDGLPSISADGLALYFCSRRAGGLGGMDLYVARRRTTSDSFDGIDSLGPAVNSAHDDWGPGVSADELHLYFMSDRPGGRGRQDLWVASRATRAAPFGRPRNLGPAVNGAALDARPNVSADGATLYFMSDRPGGSGGIDLWRSARRRAATRSH